MLHGLWPEVIRAIVLEDSPCLLHGAWGFRPTDFRMRRDGGRSSFIMCGDTMKLQDRKAKAVFLATTAVENTRQRRCF